MQAHRRPSRPPRRNTVALSSPLLADDGREGVKSHLFDSSRRLSLVCFCVSDDIRRAGRVGRAVIAEGGRPPRGNGRSRKKDAPERPDTPDGEATGVQYGRVSVWRARTEGLSSSTAATLNVSPLFESDD